MPIPITDAGFSTMMIILVLLLFLILGNQKGIDKEVSILSSTTTKELKGLSILAIIFAHIGYVLVSDSQFLYPLSTFAGVGVDIFLLTSGYGLTMSMLRSPLSIGAFYQKRLIKIYIPFWCILSIIFITDILFLGRHYDIFYIIQSFFGWFPSADVWNDVNSPFWYMTWILGSYILFPIFFSLQRVWLTAIVLMIIANIITWLNPLTIQTIWLHQLHTCAFSLGILLAWFLNKKTTYTTILWAVRAKWYIGWKFAIFVIMISISLYIATHIDAFNGSLIGSMIAQFGGNPHIIMTQLLSLCILSMILIIFIFKTSQNRFLALFGTYSYELYLIHWPLLSRYDIFFHTFPAWIATILWLIVLLMVSYGLQRVLRKIT